MKADKPPRTIRRDDIEWIEIGRAAKFSRTKAVAIGAQITAGTIRSHVEGGLTYIPISSAHRLKRETGAMLSVKRKAGKSDLSEPPGRPGPHAARERQDVLPMSSGRAGTGWLGQKPRS